MIKYLQGKPLHVRKRYAVIATGIIAIILVLIMIYVYTRPQQVERGPEEAITSAYATLLTDTQSLFHSK
ncbi:MAG: hypothetical protein ABIO57_03280 [Candidatus Paceibacterota bacterium]